MVKTDKLTEAIEPSKIQFRCGHSECQQLFDDEKDCLLHLDQTHRDAYIHSKK